MRPAWRDILVAAAMLALATVAAVAQDVVRLHTRVVVESTTVSLAQIASIEGPQRDALATLVVREGAKPGDRIALAEIRELIARHQGIKAGRIAINGSVVELSAAPARDAGAACATTPVASAGGGARVRDAIAPFLAGHLRVERDALEVTFDEHDAPVLETHVQGRTLTLAPMGQSERMPVHVRVYEGDTMVVARTVRVGVRVRREVLIAAEPLSRGKALDERSTRRETRWVGADTLWAPPEALLGKQARTAIGSGDVISTRHVQDAVVVRRGDLVAVDCLAGGVVVRSQMRARADGRVGDMIDLVPVDAGNRGKGGRERSRSKAQERSASAQATPIRARVAGPGRAVVQATEGGGASASGLLDGKDVEGARSAPREAGMDAPINQREPSGGRVITLPLRPVEQ